MSSTSTNGSAISGEPGNATVPDMTPSSKKNSLKFCANQLARRIVQAAPGSV